MQAKGANDGRAVQDILLQAIEGSITYNLSNEQGIVHVGPWRWLFIPSLDEANESSSTLVRLHVKLDGTTLYISTTTQTSPLRQLQDRGFPQRLIIAPSGRAATVVGESTGRSGVVREQITGNYTWRRSVVTALETEGMYVDLEESWLNIELSDIETTQPLLWPARLCLTSDNPPHSGDVLNGDYDWEHWFGGLDEANDAFQKLTRSCREVVYYRCSARQDGITSYGYQSGGWDFQCHAIFDHYGGRNSFGNVTTFQPAHNRPTSSYGGHLPNTT